MFRATRLSLTTLSVSLVMTLSAAPAQAQSTTLVFNAFLSAQDPMNTQILEPWANAVAEATHGRVKIQIPPNSVAAPAQLWNSVRSGIVDGAYLYNGLLPNQLPLMQLPNLPFLGTDPRGNSVALWRTYEKYFKAVGEYKDVHLLGLVVIPAGMLFSLDRPIQSIQDLRGTKVWALPGVPAKLMETAGAGVIATPAANMSEVIASGMVKAFVGIAQVNADQFKVLRYAKSMTTVPGGITAPSFSFVVNRRKWESISEADRDIITKLSGEALADRARVYTKLEAEVSSKATQAGFKTFQASPQFVADLAKDAASLQSDWLADANRKGVNGEAAIAYYREQSTVSAK